MPEILFFLICSYFAAAAATIAGFGSSTLLIPLAIMFMDLRPALFVVACFHLFNNSFKIKLFWKSINRRLFLQFGIPSIVCSFAGAVSVALIPVRTVKIVMGVFLIVFSVYSFFKPHIGVRPTAANAVAGGGLSGFLAGLIGLGGAIRAMFLIAFGLPKEIYIATSAAVAFVIDLTRIPTYLFTGGVHETKYYWMLPFLLVSAYAGVKSGKKLLGRLAPEMFRRIVMIALLLVGIKLLF